LNSNHIRETLRNHSVLNFRSVFISVKYSEKIISQIHKFSLNKFIKPNELLGMIVMLYYLSTDEEEKDILEKKLIKIGVIGQGKMGLPISAVFLQGGYNVTGMDININIVNLINEGEPPIEREPGVKESIREGIQRGKYVCVNNIEEITLKSDILIIIIPVLLDKFVNPNLDPLKKLIEEIALYIQKGQIVVIESTVPIGTTENLVKNALDSKSGLKVGKDIGLGFAPERTSSGQAIVDIRDNYPKIVGGINKKSTDKIGNLYKTINNKGVIKMSSASSAEAVKIFKGSYRDLNIALANEFAKLSEKIGLNVHEIISAANSEPYSHIHRPGAGVGGHCIPVYPHFLMSAAASVGLKARLAKLGRDINLSMPEHVVNRIIKELNFLKKPLKDSKIVVLGLAYRGNVKEHRNSPSIEILKKLKEYDADVLLNDPVYTKEEIKQIIDVKFEQNFIFSLKDADCVVIMADHNEYRKLELSFFENHVKNTCIIYDTKNIVKNNGNIEKNNLILLKIGE